jgi:hypothetical protein
MVGDKQRKVNELLRSEFFSLIQTKLWFLVPITRYVALLPATLETDGSLYGTEIASLAPWYARGIFLRCC